MRRKALKQKKNLESSPFWNPESTELESGIQYSESGIHRVESRIQDCRGFPYMGRIKLGSSEAYLLKLEKNLSQRIEIIDIFCKNAVLNICRYLKRFLPTRK